MPILFPLCNVDFGFKTLTFFGISVTLHNKIDIRYFLLAKKRRIQIERYTQWLASMYGTRYVCLKKQRELTAVAMGLF
jgi:hypothetical protein